MLFTTSLTVIHLSDIRIGGKWHSHPMMSTQKPREFARRFRKVEVPMLFSRIHHQTFDDARRLYAGLVQQARQPKFYSDLGVPDTLDGRFELVVLHMFAVLQRVKSFVSHHHESPPRAQEVSQTIDADAVDPKTESCLRNLGQALYDIMFQDFDRALREMGVGDLGVSRRIKTMVQALHGRITAYEQALMAPQDGEKSEGSSELAQALRANLLGTVAPRDEQVEQLALYLRTLTQTLAAHSAQAILSCDVRWPVIAATPDTQSVTA